LITTASSASNHPSEILAGGLFILAMIEEGAEEYQRLFWSIVSQLFSMIEIVAPTQTIFDG